MLCRLPRNQIIFREDYVRCLRGPRIACANHAATGVHCVIPLSNRLTKLMYLWHNRITGENDVSVDMSRKRSRIDSLIEGARPQILVAPGLLSVTIPRSPNASRAARFLKAVRPMALAAVPVGAITEVLSAVGAAVGTAPGAP
jgi:hypothetical protein